MAYVIPTRIFNKDEILKAALIRLKEKKLIDSEKYEMLMCGVLENETVGEEKRDILRVLVTNKETGEDETIIFDLCRDLRINPNIMFNYYTYKFLPRVLKLGDAVRIVQEADENGESLGNFAHMSSYNAIILTANIKMITFIMAASRGPMTRYITAREAYTHKISIYKFKDPDDFEYNDNNSLDEHHEEII